MGVVGVVGVGVGVGVGVVGVRVMGGGGGGVWYGYRQFPQSARQYDFIQGGCGRTDPAHAYLLVNSTAIRL